MYISTHNVATLATPPPAVQGKDEHAYRDQEARVKVHVNVSMPSLCNTLTRQEKYNSTVGTKLDIVITGYKYIYLDSRQQPGSSGMTSIKQTSTPLLRTCEWGSHCSYSNNGKTSRWKETIGQAAWNELDKKNDAVSTTTR